MRDSRDPLAAAPRGPIVRQSVAASTQIGISEECLSRGIEPLPKCCATEQAGVPRSKFLANAITGARFPMSRSKQMAGSKHQARRTRTPSDLRTPKKPLDHMHHRGDQYFIFHTYRRVSFVRTDHKALL